MQGSDRIGKITSDENLSDSVHSQHFAGKKGLLGVWDFRISKVCEVMLRK